MDVLILHRDLRWLGGVEAYFAKLANKFSMRVTHFVMGRRPDESGSGSQLVRLISDYFRFCSMLRKDRYAVVHVNPSLETKAFLREGIFLLLARLQGKKTVVFIRGWQTQFESFLARNLWLFRLLYGKSDAFIVLAEDFRKVLRSWGCTAPIHLEVTVADDDTLKDFDIEETIALRERDDRWRIFFSGRILKVKGVYEVIRAAEILGRKYPDIELVIAGDGEELPGAKRFVADRNISNVRFTGYVMGDANIDLYKTSHVFCFPTQHGEGFPNVIAEAMAFGLPVITREVGGIKDFFVDGKHGFATQRSDPEAYAELVGRLYADRALCRQISLHNYHYARSTFLASKAAARLEGIYRGLIEKDLR